MSSRNQVQGIGYRTRLLGAPASLAGTLDALSQKTADNRWVIYVAPLGGGRHLVRNDCNDQTYDVGSAVNTTFREGDSVLVGSNGGTAGEVIIAGPDLSRSGAGGTAQEISYRAISRGIVAPSSCPVALTGRSYLSIVPLSDGYQCCLYRDAVYLSDKGVPWGVGLVMGSPAWPQRLAADIIVSGAASTALYYTIDPIAGTVATATMSWAGGVGPMLVSGGYVYWVAYPNDIDPAASVQLYRSPVGFAGDVDEPTARVGGVFTISGLAAYRGLCSLGGAQFVLPATVSSVPKLLYFNGSSWVLRSVPVLGAEDPAPGFQVSGGAFRLAHRPLVDATSGESYLFPDTPEWTGFHSTSYTVFMSVSPGRGEILVYPVDDGLGGFKLLRIPLRPVGASCSAPYQVIGTSPHGQPTHLLPRDH